MLILRRPTESRPNHSSRSVRCYLQSSPKPPQPLSHSSKSESSAAQFNQFVLFFRWYPFPTIPNFNRQTVPFLAETDCSRRTTRMTVNVSQTLLHDSEDSDLQFFRGLASALRWYVDGLTVRSNIKVDLEIPSDFGRLSSPD